MNAESRV